MKIKDYCSEERPREKMLLKGAEALTNAELLAILIGSGTRKENVLEVANRLLSKNEGRLSVIASMSYEEMRDTNGIGQSRYAAIAAAFELGKRRCLEAPGFSKVPLTDPEIVWRIMIPHMLGLSHEELWVLYLNSSNYLVYKEEISKGGTSATISDPRIVVKKALDHKASGLVIVHNHPSGNPRPSEMDIEQTQTLKSAANTFDIALIDHIIICDDCWFSFANDKVVQERADEPQKNFCEKAINI